MICSGGSPESGTGLVCGKGEHRREELQASFVLDRQPTEPRTESLEPRIPSNGAQLSSQRVHDRMQRTLRVIRRAVEGNRHEGVSTKPLSHFSEQASLADPRLRRHEDRLSRSFLGLIPAALDQTQLAFTPHERRKPGCHEGFGASRFVFFRKHAVERHRLSHALQRLRPAVLDREHPGYEAQRRVADHHGVGLGRAFEAGRDVRGVAEGERLALRAASHLAHHDGAGVDADPRGKTDAVLAVERVVHGTERRQDFEPRPDRTLSVVLVRLRVAEVDEQPVAQVLRDVTLVALDDRGGGFLIGAHDSAQILGVEALGEIGRAHQVAEHDCELPSLGVSGGSNGLCIALG